MRRRPQPASYGEREASLLRILHSEYEGLDDLAADCLAALEGAPYDEQCRLFTIVLTRYGTFVGPETRISGRDTVSPKEWDERAGYMQVLARQWSSAALRQNATAENTAREIWDGLTLVEGTDRIVALGLLLGACRFAPYAHLPSHLLRILPPRVYAEAHNRCPEAVALLRRIINDERVATLEAAEAMARTLEGIGDHEGRVALLADLFEYAKNSASLDRKSEELQTTFKDQWPHVWELIKRILGEFQDDRGSATEDYER